MFRKALEALIAGERGKQYHGLADRLAAHLNSSAPSHRVNKASMDAASSLYEVHPQRTVKSLILPESVAPACKELIEVQYQADLF